MILLWQKSGDLVMLCPAMFSSNTHFKLSPNPEQRRQRPLGRFKPNPKAKLREQLHEVMRFFHYSARTEETYWQWIFRFLKFQKGKAESRKQKVEMGEAAGWKGSFDTSPSVPLPDRGGEGGAEGDGEHSTFNVQHSTSKGAGWKQGLFFCGCERLEFML